MSEQKEKCASCKRTTEHLATVLSFQILEKIVDKPLRIRGAHGREARLALGTHKFCLEELG